MCFCKYYCFDLFWFAIYENWFCFTSFQFVLLNWNKNVYQRNSSSLQGSKCFCTCSSALHFLLFFSRSSSRLNYDDFRNHACAHVTSHRNAKQPSCFAHPVHCCRWYSIYILMWLMWSFWGWDSGVCPYLRRTSLIEQEYVFKFTWSSCYYLQISRSTIQIVCHSSSQMLSILNSS